MSVICVLLLDRLVRRESSVGKAPRMVLALPPPTANRPPESSHQLALALPAGLPVSVKVPLVPKLSVKEAAIETAGPNNTADVKIPAIIKES